MTIAVAKFEVGQMISHKKYDYRGVIFDVDPCFQGTEDWYEQVARSRPPRDRPWYHVLVHEASHTTYVAEQHLESDDSGRAIRHDMLDYFFAGFRDGRYMPNHVVN